MIMEAPLVCSSDPTLAECRVKHRRMDAWPPWLPVTWPNWAGWSSLVGARAGARRGGKRTGQRLRATWLGQREVWGALGL